jgi:energy-coupling factor transporter ATP-binding protein EcfA2
MVFKNKNYYRTIFPNKDARKFEDYQISYKTLWGAALNRLKYKKDVFILITGKTGNGKSTITGKMNFRFAELEDNFILNNGEKMFIPEKHYIIDGDEFAYKMITEEGSSLWYDEAREGSNRQGWYDKVNKAIKQRKNTNRKLFNIYWFCMPLESEFDPKLAAHLTVWIWVKKRKGNRAVCEVYVANNQKKGGKGLNIEAIIKREEKWEKENPKRTTIDPTIHPEYCGRLVFAPFTKDEEKRYNQLVKLKSATGKYTEEELAKFGIESKKTDEEIAEAVAKDIVAGKIESKIEALERLREIEGISDSKRISLCSEYTKLYDLGTFNQAFTKKNNKLANLAEKLKRKKNTDDNN